MQNITARLIARRADLEREMFKMPPADMLDFNRRIGGWLEVSALIDWIADLERQDEEDLDKD